MKSFLVALALASSIPIYAQTQDTISRGITDTSVFVMHRSPTVATLLSMVIPGAGQIYNEDFLKVPIIWGIGGVLLYQAISDNNQYLHYKELYQSASDSSGLRSLYFQEKESYRDSRDYYGAFVVLVYVLNILDAYVGAHLFDFPSTGATHVSLSPASWPSRGMGGMLTVRF